MSGASVDLGRALEVARQLAREAGELLRRGHDRPLHVRHKGEVDLVTDFDRRSEELVVRGLTRAFPDHTVISEEGAEVHARDEHAPLWYVDPLDGTTNYAHHHPWYAVSIGLELAGQPVLGVVLAPELGWEFFAARSRGAWRGAARLWVSDTPRLEQALVATGFPYDRRNAADNNVPELAGVIRRCQGIRRCGVASLDCAGVAWGILDAYWERKLKPWDVAAGAAIVLQAGGRLSHPAGGPFAARHGDILATNGHVHDELVTVLEEARRDAEL